MFQAKETASEKAEKASVTEEQGRRGLEIDKNKKAGGSQVTSGFEDAIKSLSFT